MSESVFVPGPPAGFKRAEIPVTMGIITGIVGVVLSVVAFMFLLPKSYVLFLVGTGLMWVAPIVLYVVAGIRQRKAMGGYITLKQAFQAIFIVILISSIITTIWGVVYAKYIDPEIGVKMKESTLAFMQRMKVPEAKMDETAKSMDKQLADGLKPGKLLYAFAQGVVIHSIIGLIIAAIIKRNPPRDIVS